MGRRHIFIVRHGQTDPMSNPGDGLGGSLTELGREQAALAGKRLASLPVDAIHHSTLRRATETAAIINQQLPRALPMQPSDSLREVLPYIPADFIAWYLQNEQAISENSVQVPREFIAWLDIWPHGTDPEKLARGFDQARRAYEQYFVSTSPGTPGQVDVLVCHGNILRYFVARARGAPLETWIDTDINNCGISEVVIEENGQIVLVSHNSTSHLPEDKQTFV